jgi:hypothetical protein
LCTRDKEIPARVIPEETGKSPEVLIPKNIHKEIKGRRVNINKHEHVA